MRICNYSLGNNYDKFGRIETNQIILARPGKRVLGVINGVVPDSCRVEINLNNTWVLDFDVNRIVDGDICNFYDYIEQKMELHLPGYGWFKITEEPVMSNNGNYETLSVHAESLEIEFQQYVLKGFECNTGTTSSLEYLATDNVYYLNDAGEEFLPEYDDGTYYPLFRENVSFYHDTSAWETMMAEFATTDGSEQALLGMIHDYPIIMDCWRINYNLDNFDAAIQYAIDHGSINAKARRILESYLGNVKDQQTAYNLTHVYPDILTYLINPANSMIVDINYKSYDFNHREDYTLAEIIDLELRRQKDLSLLDTIANHYGWRVGFVDDSVVTDSDIDDDRIPLSQKIGSFQVDSENAYTFMTQEMASYFRCVFVFDSYEKTVNVYNINNIGVDTNIFLSFHNIQNSVERSGNDVIRTAFYIQGGDDLTPIEANFGSNEIWDLSYYMNTQHFPQSTIDKYNAWLEYRENQRQLYMNKAVAYRNQLEVVDELYNRVPIDSSDNTQYGTMTDEQLLEEKAKNEALVAGIESKYVDNNDQFDIDILRENDPLVYQEYLIITGSVLSSPRDALEYLQFDPNAGDYGDYVFINGNEDTSDYRLGNIDTTIFNRKVINGEFVLPGDNTETIQAKNYYKHQKEYLDNYIYDFETYGDAYGVAELQNRLDDLENKYTTLWTKGYGVDMTQEEREADPYKASQYDLYIKYRNAYDECKQVLEERTEEYDDARDTLQTITDEMIDIAKDVDIANDQFGFTQDELDLINRYVYYTDYVNDNMIITSIYTNEEIVETEYQLIKDAQEELYAIAHPQWIWNTTQDNLFMIVDNDDWYGNVPHPTYEDWRNNLMIGNYIHVGFREDDHLPDSVYVDQSSNQVKLRLITIGLNPFMIEPTIDLTFSSMIQYKSRRNDFVDLLGLSSGVGDHQVTATFQSKKLDDTFQIDSSFVMKLLKNGAFANYAAGSILNGGTLDSLVVPTIYATDINVDQITGNIAKFMETYTEYLNAHVIVTDVLKANNIEVQELIADAINALTTKTIQLSATNATIDAGYVTNLVAGRLSVAQLAAGDLTLSNSMRIKSDNGYLAMNGSVLQIGAHQDQNGNMIPQIQLGYGANNEPSLVFRDQNGTSGILIGYTDNTGKPSIAIYDTEGNIMINSGGIAEAENRVIADELIVNDMVKQGTLGKERMNFNVMEAGDDIIIEQITYTDGSKFGNEYTTFEQNITDAVAEFVDVLPSVELTGRQTFTVDEDSNILPSKITIYANPRNGFIPHTWTIDGVDASQYVSSDGLSIDVPNTVMTNVTSAVVRCQNEDGSSYDAITLSKLPSYNSSITTVSIDNNPVQFFTSTSGVPLLKQTATSKITVYKGAEQFYNFSINNLVTPTGVTAIASSNSIEITVSPTAAIGNTGTITFDVVVNGGTTISKSITINRLVSTDSESTIVEYTLQTSNLECSDSAVWTELRPTPSAGQFMWYRYRTDYSNGDPSKYSKPHYISTITGLINMTDAVNKSITNKIWKDDFETYDTQVIRHRESEISQTVDSISMTVSETSSNLDTLTTNYQQTANEFHWLFTNTAQTGQPTSMSLTNNGLSLINGTIAVTDGSNTTTITPNSILSNTLTSVDGQSQINLREGTFNFGNGALSWDGDTLTIGGIDKTAIISALAEGALQIRYTDSGNTSTDENEPLENDEEEQLEGVGYTTLYFDNGYDDNDPMRSAKPWVNFHGHRIEVNPFEIELSDIIIPSVTQFVVYRFGDNGDYQYTVWYDTEYSVWKAINVDCQTELQDQEPANYKQVISWEWNTDEDIIVAEFTKELDGDVNYESYYPSKTYQSIQQAAMLQSWGINGALTETTTINGGSITTGTIDSLAIKTEGIQSRNYSQTPTTNTYTLPDSYVFTPIAYEEYIMLEQNSNTSFTITPQEDGEVVVILRSATNVNGYTFYYSTDYQGNDLSIGGGYTSSGDDTEIMFEEPQNSGYYVFDSPTDSIVFYITFPYAQQGISFNLTVYLSDGTNQISFVDFNSSITCNGYYVGETYKIYTGAEIADNNVITFTFNGDAGAKTLHLLAQDINPDNIVSAQLKCYFDNFTTNIVDLTSSAVGYLSYDYNIQYSSSTITQAILTLTIDNLNSNQQYIIESYIADGFEHELWDSIIYNDEQLNNAVETVTLDPIYSDTGTWFNLADSGFIRSKNFSIDADGNAYFKGTLNATRGNIGGWTISNGYLYYGDNYPTSESMIFSPIGVVSTNSVGESNYQQTWLFTVHDKFGITVNGDLYASGNFQFGGPNGIRYNVDTGEVTFGSKCIIGWDSIDDAGTVITSDSLQTVDIICQNLKVKSANIDVSQGKITAAQLDVGNISVAGATWATYVNAENIQGTTITGKTISGGAIYQTHNYGGGTYGDLGLYNCSTSIENGVVSTSVVSCTYISNGGYNANTVTCWGGLDITNNVLARANLTVYGDVSANKLYASNPSATSAGANCYITSGGEYSRTSNSSIRYKNIGQYLSNADIEKLYNIPVYWFKYKNEFLSEGDERYGISIPGFIVEDWDPIMPIAVDHNENGLPEMWNSNIVVPLMFQMIKNEHERNDKLQTEITELKTMIKQLTER